MDTNIYIYSRKQHPYFYFHFVKMILRSYIYTVGTRYSGTHFSAPSNNPNKYIYTQQKKLLLVARAGYSASARARALAHDRAIAIARASARRRAIALQI